MSLCYCEELSGFDCSLYLSLGRRVGNSRVGGKVSCPQTVPHMGGDNNWFLPSHLGNHRLLIA